MRLWHLTPDAPRLPERLVVGWSQRNQRLLMMAQEIAATKAMNPKSRHEIEEEKDIESFLRATDAELRDDGIKV